MVGFKQVNMGRGRRKLEGIRGMEMEGERVEDVEGTKDEEGEE